MSGGFPQSNTPTSAGHKRYHDEGMPWSFVVSQETEEDDNGHHHYQHDHKRLRISLPDSPGVVSISSMMDCSPTPQRLENVMKISQPSTFQWWKQKHTPNHHSPLDNHTTTMTTPTGCFICQRPQQQRQQQHIPHAQAMPFNALLSYFTPKNASTRLATLLPMDVDTKPSTRMESFHSCFFCTRQACSSCSRPCESCGQTFCSLCSTVDYTTRAEHTFCLDCPNVKALPTSNARPTDDGDAIMHMDSNEG